MLTRHAVAGGMRTNIVASLIPLFDHTRKDHTFDKVVSGVDVVLSGDVLHRFHVKFQVCDTGLAGFKLDLELSSLNSKGSRKIDSLVDDRQQPPLTKLGSRSRGDLVQDMEDPTADLLDCSPNMMSTLELLCFAHEAEGD